MRLLPAQFTGQPGLRQTPVPQHALLRDLQNGSRLLHAQPPEEAQFHHARLARIDLGERIERLVHSHDIRVRFRRGHPSLLQRDPGSAAAALGGLAGAGMVHQDAAHDLGAGGQEMRTVVPVGPPGVDQPQVGFIDERRGLECVARRLGRHVVLGDPV